MMRGFVMAAVAAVLALAGAGCGLLTTEQVDAVHAVVLAKIDDAWKDKGAAAVADKLVEDGKLTQAQADALNAAAQQGYGTLREKAEEIMAGGLDNPAK